jgi:large conductance mechanosensitive channel
MGNQSEAGPFPWLGKDGDWQNRIQAAPANPPKGIACIKQFSRPRTKTLIALQQQKKKPIMKIIREFKAFAMRSNVVDLAVGVIIGAAFNGIVNSLVKDAIMPPIGNAEPAVIRYGVFINNVISFFIVAFCIFLLVKGMNKLIRHQEAVTPPTSTEQLLTEIRNLLKNRL